MKKSKYIILSPFYFDFNDDLTNITKVKELFKKQNILDLERFDKIEYIRGNIFYGYSLYFIYLSSNIISIKMSSFGLNYIKYINLFNCKKLLDIEDRSFEENNIEYLDLSNCASLIAIGYNTLNKNKIKKIKFSDNIKKIDSYSFYKNNIKYLDLSNCNNLNEIDLYAFSKNPLQEIKILNKIIVSCSYSQNLSYDAWNKFAKYYNDNNKKAGNYKLENNEWKWYPL